MKIEIVAKIADVERCDLLPKTIAFIERQVKITYSDMLTPKEHLYSVDDIQDEFIGENNPDPDFKNQINKILSIADKKGITYIRLVIN